MLVAQRRATEAMREPRVLLGSWVVGLLEDLDIDVVALLGPAAAARLRDADEGLSVPAADFYVSWTAASRAYGDEDAFAIAVVTRLTPDMFDPLLYAALAGPDFATAARRAARHKSALGPLRSEVLDIGTLLVVRIHSDGAEPPPPSLVMAELFFWLALMRRGTRRQAITPHSVSMQTPPDEQTSYRSYCGVPVVAGEHAQIAFTVHDATRRFKTEQPWTWHVLEMQLERRLLAATPARSTTEKTQLVIGEMLALGMADLDRVAHRLCLSSRSLQRRLAAENITFRTLLEETRRALATASLGQPGSTVRKVAAQLGYGDASSFRRAFRDWTGQTPEQFMGAVAVPGGGASVGAERCGQRGS